MVGQFQLAGFDLRQVQHVVEHRQQLLAGLAHDHQPLALFLGQFAALHDLGHGQHAVQRGADLVAHIGQELRLGDVGRVGGVAGLHQVFERLAEFLVVGVDLRQQVVERVGQPQEHVVVGVDRVEPSKLAAERHLGHRPRQSLDRRGDPAREAMGDEQRDAAGAEEKHAGQSHESGQQADDGRLARPHHNLADDLAIKRHRRVNGARRADVVALRRRRGKVDQSAAARIHKSHIDQIAIGGGRGDIVPERGHITGGGVRRGGAGDHAGQGLLFARSLLAAHAPLLQHEADASSH